MRLKRVTVVGGSGFVGRYIVQRLAASGAVIAVVSRNASAAGYLRPMGDVGQIAPIDAGIADTARLKAAIAGSDAVIYAAGILYERRRQRFDLIHHRGPARLAELARQAGVRQFLHVSAIGADPHSPSAYARSKATGEAAIRAAFPEAVILRPSVVFGPEDDFFNRFGAMAQIFPALPLIGGGKTRFQPVYVADVADAALAALTRADAAGRIYELGGPQVLTFRELMERLLAELNRKRLLVTLPFSLARFAAAFLQWLPHPPLTPDQVKLLKRDNVVDPRFPDLAALGVTPTALDLVLPTYLDRFRRGGRYASPRAAAAGPSEA